MDPYGRIKRNMTDELLEGATDGALKKARPDTSNKIADPSDSARRLLSHVEGGYDWDEYNKSTREYAAGYVRGAY